MKLYKSNVRLNIRKHFFSQRIIDTWNNLPQNVVDAPSINSFKDRLDKLWNDMVGIQSSASQPIIIQVQVFPLHTVISLVISVFGAVGLVVQ